MQALAAYLMRGRAQAALVAATTAILSLLAPLVGLISAGVIALVSLRLGAREGLVVSGLAGLISGLFAFATLGNPLASLGFLFALWLPVWLLSLVLRTLRSLSFTVQFGGFLGLLLFAAMQLLLEDPVRYWSEILEPLRDSLVQSAILKESGSRDLVAEVARWMTSAFATAFYFQMLLALFLGRWWHASLDHPGGFGEEFRSLRLYTGVGFLGLGLLALLALGVGNRWAAEGLLLLTPLFFLQGLAVIHALVHNLKASKAWLVGLYGFLLLGAPQGEILLAGIGLGDIWMDLRSKIRPKDA